MTNNCVSTKALTKCFGSLRAVDTLDLTVQKGELFGLLGPNGSGKTTIVRMLCTLIEPTSGTASVAGFDVRKQSHQVRRHIGIVSEGVSLYKDLTVEENLKLLSTLYEIPSGQAERRIREVLDMFSFKDKSQRMVGALSTGWAKKAMICAALIHSPDILFLDEVTAGLDPQSAIALQEFTRSLCDQGVTVMWTTHYMGEPDRICDHIGIMFAGRLVKIGTPSEVENSAIKRFTIEVETPDLSPQQVQIVQHHLIEICPDCQLSYRNPTLVVSSDHTDGLAEEVADALIREGAKIHSLTTSRPSLEEAFISLTGTEAEIDRFLEHSENGRRSP